MVADFDPDEPASEIIDLNILPEKYRGPGLRPSSVLPWALALAATLLLLPSYYLFARANARIAVLRTDLTRVEGALARQDPSAVEAERLRTTLEDVLTRIDDFEEAIASIASGQVGWTGPLRAIREAIPDGVSLTSLSQSDRQITLVGTATDHSRVETLKVNLENSGLFSSVTIQSVVALPTATATVTPMPSSTPIPTATPTPMPTSTPTPTSIPTATPTAAPTATSTLVAQITFWADRETIERGECATLYWYVGWVKAVYLDEEGVTGNETREVCPSYTRTYTLRVVKMDDTVEIRQITITVTEPESELPVSPYGEPPMSAEPQAGRHVAGLAALAPTGDKSRLAAPVSVADLSAGVVTASSIVSEARGESFCGRGPRGGQDGPSSSAGVEFELLLELADAARWR